MITYHDVIVFIVGFSVGVIYITFFDLLYGKIYKNEVEVIRHHG